MSAQLEPHEGWPKTTATVTECRYETGALQAMAFGIPATKHFEITFNYWAGETLHTGQYLSAKAVPQGTLFPISYDPDEPHIHSQSNSARRPSLLYTLGVVAFATLTSAVILYTHGCHS